MSDESAVLDELLSSPASESTSESPSTPEPEQTSAPADFGAMIDGDKPTDGGGLDAALERAGAETAPSPAAPTDLRGILTSQGYQLDGVDDSQLAAYIQQTAQQAAQAQQFQQQYAQLQQQYAEAQQYAAYGRQYLAQQQAAQPAPPPAPQHPSLIKPKPEFNQEWLRLVQEDERTGRYVPVDGHVDPALAHKVNAYFDWRKETADKLLDTYVPPEQLKEQLMQEVRQSIQQEIQQHQAQQQQHQYIMGALQEIGPLVYQYDAQGNVARDINGRPVLNQTGQLYADAVQQLEQNGVRDPRIQDALARQIVNGQLAARAPAAPQVQAPADPKQEFTRRTNPVRRPNAAAAVSRPDHSPSVNPDSPMLFDQLLNAEAAKAGFPLAN